MKALVIYETEHGNTEKIALIAQSALGDDTKAARARDLHQSDLKGYDLVVVGAPTYGGRPMPPMQTFLDGLQAGALTGVKVAAFDTRLVSRFAKLFGYAADKIGAILVSKGGVQVAPPEGFYVKGTKGPLKEGEETRASEWGRAIREKAG